MGANGAMHGREQSGATTAGRARVAALLCATPLLLACGGSFRGSQHAISSMRLGAEAEHVDYDGSLTSYQEGAMARDPALRAQLERWRAANARRQGAGVLPDPTLLYSYYAAPVQTRAGDQRQRISVRQSLPWPTRLGASADAARARTEAAEHRFEAEALLVADRVAQAWWRLWLARQERAIAEEQVSLLSTLTSTLQGRLEVGSIPLARLAQLQLRMARMDDLRQQAAASEQRALTALRAAVSEPDDERALTTPAAPPAARVAEDLPSMRRALQEHPRLTAVAASAEAFRADAAVAEAERWPRLTFGADWIETAPTAGTSGDDALLLSVGLSLPLWQQAAGARQDAADAEANARNWEREALLRDASSELEQLLIEIADSYRRITLYEHSLLPQAQTVVEASFGVHAVGQIDITTAVVAVDDLLGIALTLARTRAQHGRAWSRLRALVGRAVRAREESIEESASDD